MILVIDNYDSFTYNLVQFLGECGADVTVRRNDAITGDEVIAMAPAGVVLSPGPCTPKQSGVCLDLLRLAISGRLKAPVMGVCLGNEAIGEVQGSPIVSAGQIRHGKASMIRHDGRGLLEGMPNPFQAIRYHSLVVDRTQAPAGFIVTATSEDDGEIMGLRHETLPIEGLQFHPESVLTEDGIRMVRNFVNQTRALQPA
jgi:anthranilate synthase/aminodeoxychorismate synthase-like glutamine amidotransferase